MNYDNIFQRTNLAPIGVKDKDHKEIRKESLLSINKQKENKPKDLNRTKENKDFIIRLYNFLNNKCIETITEDGQKIVEIEMPEKLYQFKIECLVYFPPFVYINTFIVLLCIYILPFIIYIFVPTIRFHYIPIIMKTLYKDYNYHHNHHQDTKNYNLNVVIGNYLTSLGCEMKSGLKIHIVNLFLLGVILKYLIKKRFYISKGNDNGDKLVWIVSMILTFGVFILLPLLSYNFDTILGITSLFIGCCLEFKLIDDNKDVDITTLILYIISLPKNIIKNTFGKKD